MRFGQKQKKIFSREIEDICENIPKKRVGLIRDEWKLRR